MREERRAGCELIIQSTDSEFFEVEIWFHHLLQTMMTIRICGTLNRTRKIFAFEIEPEMAKNRIMNRKKKNILNGEVLSLVPREKRPVNCFIVDMTSGIHEHRV